MIRWTQVKDAIKCRTFASTLKGPARAWYGTLKDGSISSFQQLSDLFAANFVSSRRHKKSTAVLMNLRQEKGESLRDYLRPFNREALEIPNLPQNVAITALTCGLIFGQFQHAIARKPPKTLSELLQKAEGFIQAEETMAAQRERGKDDLRNQIKSSKKSKNEKGKYKQATAINQVSVLHPVEHHKSSDPE